MKKTIIAAFFVLSTLFFGQRSSAQTLAISTNALEWGFLTPNVEFALVTGEKTSLHLGGAWNHRPYGLDLGGFMLCPEFRFWPKGRPFAKLYIGVGGDFVSYNRTNIQGRAFAFGPTIGYDFVLTEKWSIEINMGAGGAPYYQNVTEPDVDPYVQKGFVFAPVKLGVNFIFIID